MMVKLENSTIFKENSSKNRFLRWTIFRLQFQLEALLAPELSKNWKASKRTLILHDFAENCYFNSKRLLNCTNFRFERVFFYIYWITLTCLVLLKIRRNKDFRNGVDRPTPHFVQRLRLNSTLKRLKMLVCGKDTFRWKGTE